LKQENGKDGGPNLSKGVQWGVRGDNVISSTTSMGSVI